MSRPRPAESAALERLIRGSQALDPATRRQWLQVLEYLTPTDRERLAEILAADGQPDPDPPA